MHCSSSIPDCSLSIVDYQFSLELKILPLGTYDLILGIDWLEQHSPMKVHWKQKWLAIPYKGGTVVLQGCLSDISCDMLLQLLTVEQQESVDLSEPLPNDIQ